MSGGDGGGRVGRVEFLFTGQDSSEIPRDVTHVRVDASVEAIGEDAFCNFNDLAEVDICNGVQRIERCAFANCRSLQRVVIPSSVKEIGWRAFSGCNRLEEVGTCNGLQTIQTGAFNGCGLKRITIPPSVTRIGNEAFFDCERMERVELFQGLNYVGEEAFANCTSLKSVEIPASVIAIQTGAFNGCISLRNIAVPTSIYALGELFGSNYDLLKLKNLFPMEHFSFGQQRSINHKLKSRFDGLPVHSACYYQISYPASEVIERLNHSEKEGLFDHTAYAAQDCLGMTPLHILAISSKPNNELCRFLIEKHVQSVAVKDKWGCLPLFYAIWNNSSQEMVELLISSQKSALPDFTFDWNGMVRTVCRAGSPIDAAIMVFEVQQASFPDQSVDMHRAARELTIACLVRCYSPEDFMPTWNAMAESLESRDTLQGLIQCLHDIRRTLFEGNGVDLQALTEEFTKPLEGWWRPGDARTSLQIFRSLIHNDLPERVNTIGIRMWRERVKNQPHAFSVLRSVHGYEEQYEKLNEAIFTLELGLWKTKLQEMEGMDVTKEQCRINCGADIIIPNVYPYLIDNRDVHAQKSQQETLLERLGLH